MNAYDKLWKKVDSLLNKSGLTESALKEVNQIYALAKKEKNEPQQIKALTYRIVLDREKQESEQAATAAFAAFDKEIASTTGNTKAILQSIAAGNYRQYYNNQRWRLRNRTATVNFVKDDVNTWSADDFHKKITELFLASLSNEVQLQQTKLSGYDAIIRKGNMRELRPTLFDLLAHRALDYFKSDDRDITRPAYLFEINQPAALADVNSFVNEKFQTKDDQSNQFKALQLFQRLLKFHLNDAKPEALVDADIERIEFTNTYGTMPNKDELYKQALEKLTAKYGRQPFAAQAWYLLASYYSGLAGRYNAQTDTAHRYEYVKAVSILNQVLENKTPSEGRANSYNLLQQIKQPILGLQAEKVNVPAQNFRAQVSFRNIATLQARIIKVNDDELDGNRWDDKYWSKLIKQPAFKTFVQRLPDTKDYQQHTTEIPVAGLPVGKYILLVSPDEFSLTRPMAAQHFYVSNIAYISSEHNHHVLNRTTGEPIARAAVQIWNRYYDYKASKYQDRKGEQFVTDQYGGFTVSRSKTRDDNQYRIEINAGDDRLAIQDYQYNGSYNPNDHIQKETNSTFLFTDRAIYRPGQIVYVKGIMVNRKNVGNQSSIITNRATTLDLMDANGQKVTSIQVSTNAYGSYSARFTLPTGLLNGNFRIVDTFTKSDVNFSVEEYKRPKFEVTVDQPTGTYRLNETITVEGTAKAYAGNNIDGASVSYRVVRRNIYPFFDYYMPKIWPPGRMDEVEITNGATTTDANGKFKVSFTALPESNADKKSMVRFIYQVSADVTDINGETRSGNTSVSVGFQALVLDVDAEKELPVDSLSTLRIRSSNLNGVFEQATVTLNAYPLQAPQRQFRSRYWEQPDEFVLTEEEFHRLFPNDIYKDENQPSKWQRGASVLNITDTTSADGKFATGKLKLPAGWYAIEVTTKDRFGEEVKALKYLLLSAATDLHPEAYFAIDSKTQPYEPGQTIQYTIKTNLSKAFIIRDLVRKDDKSVKDFINLSQNQQSFNIPVTEEDRGNIGVTMAFVKNNRFYTASELFAVPYSNKDLKITFETFRDKTLPGSQEKWKVKLSGSKNDKVAAEMLTAMYDASLDQFVVHNWNKPSLYSTLYMNKAWTGRTNFTAVQADRKNINTDFQSFRKEYDELETGAAENGYFAGGVGGRRLMYMRGAPKAAAAEMAMVDNAAPVAAEKREAPGDLLEDQAITMDSASAAGTPASAPSPSVRTNLNETAFFLPELQTDADGNVEFSFTMPEALTTWKWMIMAHTKELAFGYDTKNVITQKELMVQPNAPRFLREGDRIDFSTKIVNLSGRELTGQVQLLLIDPSTNQSVDGWFNNVMPNQYFTVAAGQSTPVSFSMLIPYQYNRPLTYRVVAEAKGGEQSLSDGEQAILPVVSNRMLVTESLPLPMRGNGSKDFSFSKLLQSGSSETLGHQSLTVEFTTNPAWYAVQSLPYLMEYPYECAEQLFNRYYANALATNIANSTPTLKATFERWKNADTSALLSNLMKNEELKSVLLQETPWVLQAQDETKQKKQIGLLFDMVRMSTELQSSLNKLLELQSSNGGFVWFKGGPDDRFISQYIATGVGRLRRLKALPQDAEGMKGLIETIVPYLDKKIKEDYDNLVKHKAKLTDNNLGYTQIQYLYMRSFFPEIKLPATSKTAYDYYRKQSQQFWLKQNRYMQGMIAIALNRTGDKTVSKAIMASLKENAIRNEEMGMYWKETNTGYGYYWHQAPIEKQSLLIEAFKEVSNDTKAVEDAKTWLLKQKQTQNWRTTKATADAVYALLLQGNNWLASTPEVQVTLGSQTIRSNEKNQEAGTGYFKDVIEGSKVKPEMGSIKVTVSNAANNAAPSWGSVYWQYFEDMDKITHAATPLNLQKKLFVEKNSDRGPVLQPVNEGDILKVGDKIKVRIELRVDRDMEYVHMKDMRASCMEPVNVLSGYRYQGGLDYYESTKDASTNFFFGYLRKGTWVFEYPMFVTHTGNFSNGITTIQCMYAPEFTSHSEGVKVVVEK